MLDDDNKGQTAAGGAGAAGQAGSEEQKSGGGGGGGVSTRATTTSQSKQTLLGTVNEGAEQAVNPLNPGVKQMKLDALNEEIEDQMREFRSQFMKDAVMLVICALYGIFALYFTNNLANADANVSDAIHFAVVSMSTVGYGDVYPKGRMGARLLGSIFLLFGTAIVAKFAGDFFDFMVFRAQASGQQQHRHANTDGINKS